MSEYEMTEESTIYEVVGGVPVEKGKTEILEEDPQQRYVSIPETKWWQLRDVFTKLDEYINAQIRLDNLIVGRLDTLIALSGGPTEVLKELSTRDITNKIRPDTIPAAVLNTATPLYAYTAKCKRAQILADPANPLPTSLFLGGSDVAPPETGFPLAPGTLYPTTLDSLDKIYYFATVAGNVMRVIREWWEEPKIEVTPEKKVV